MKTFQTRSKRNGFTLIELLVAMAITAIIVGVLVSITGIAIDTWNRSRQELRAARQAKAMLDLMASDFEALVIRGEGSTEWLVAVFEEPLPEDPADAPPAGIHNAAKLLFYTAATDRYNGQIGVKDSDSGGDISLAVYQLMWKDPVRGGAIDDYPNFVLNRLLVSPKMGIPTDLRPGAFDLLGSTDLVGAFNAFSPGLLPNEKLDADQNFLCENIFQFTVVFHVETFPSAGQVKNELISIQANAPGKQEFRIKGTGLETSPVDATLAGGRVTAVEISVTVLTDTGMSLLRSKPALAEDGQWMSKNSYHYSKLIPLPRM